MLSVFPLLSTEAWVEGTELNDAQKKWIEDQKGKVILRYFSEVEPKIIKLVGNLTVYKESQKVFRLFSHPFISFSSIYSIASFSLTQDTNYFL